MISLEQKETGICSKAGNYLTYSDKNIRLVHNFASDCASSLKLLICFFTNDDSSNQCLDLKYEIFLYCYEMHCSVTFINSSREYQI